MNMMETYDPTKTPEEMTATTALTEKKSTAMDCVDQNASSNSTETKNIAAAASLVGENSSSLNNIAHPPLSYETGNGGSNAVVGRTAEEDANDPRTKVLKRGDLVNVAERRESRVKNRDGGLARIHRAISISSDKIPSPPPDVVDGKYSSISIEDAQSRHPYKYDVDWVLGGRLFGVIRRELTYTTTEAEGLAEGSSDARPKRKRRATAALRESKEGEESKAKKNKVTAKSTTATKKKQAKTSSSPTKKKETKAKGSAARGGKSSKKGKKKEGADKSTDTSAAATNDKYGEPDLASETGSERPSAALDMYEKHAREFEKSLVRLERVDQFGFFLGPPLPAFDDVYSDDDDTDSGGDDNSTSENEESSASCKPFQRKKSRFPDHPPFNWTVVRKRKDRGRYVLDRVRMEKETRKELLSPYWALLGEGKGKIPAEGTPDGSGSAPVSLSFSSSDQNSDAGKTTDHNASQEKHILHPIGVDWDLFQRDVIGMCNASIGRDPKGISGGSGTLGHAANKIKEVMIQIYNRAGKRHARDMAFSDAHHKFHAALVQSDNNEAAMQCDWRKEAFPERKYERLSSSSVVCAGLSSLDERSAIYELRTSLPDSFVGISYVYDDIGESEGWMKSVAGVGSKDSSAASREKKGKKGTDEGEEEQRTTRALLSDEGVVRAQVRTTMNALLTSVQDRVMTERGVLQSRELRSANWEDGDVRRHFTGDDKGQRVLAINGSAQCEALNTEAERIATDPPPEVAEQPVWGIDCYSRRNISLCLETEFTSAIAIEFIEKWLLPAINSCPVDIAHDVSSATSMILGAFPPVSNPLIEEEQNLSSLTSLPKSSISTSFSGSHVLLRNALTEKILSSGPPWLRAAAFYLHIAVKAVGLSYFRVHPKGHGSVVLRPEGLRANTLVTYYRGEVYPPWRWGEKMDAIEKTQQRLGLRPNLPDFYNMALERPHIDPRGYGMLFVDASRKAGLGSSFSHSCDPTCEVRVAAVNGQLSLAMTTLRDVERGEELAFDYNAVTESLNEYRAAVCLCGHSSCRGSFLHFATADCYQQVMSRNAPIAVRFSGLVRGCMKKVMSKEDEEVLGNHGFGTAAFGAVSFNHHRQIPKSTAVRSLSDPLDSMDYIPIWLRTFVADTLRYIEYERRALPVAILCNHFSKEKDESKTKSISSKDSSSKDKKVPLNKKGIISAKDKKVTKSSKGLVDGENNKSKKAKATKDSVKAQDRMSGSKETDGSSNDNKSRNCQTEDSSLFSGNENREDVGSRDTSGGAIIENGKKGNISAIKRTSSDSLDFKKESESVASDCVGDGKDCNDLDRESEKSLPTVTKPNKQAPSFTTDELQPKIGINNQNLPDMTRSANVKKEDVENDGSVPYSNQTTSPNRPPPKSPVKKSSKKLRLDTLLSDDHKSRNTSSTDVDRKNIDPSVGEHSGKEHNGQSNSTVSHVVTSGKEYRKNDAKRTSKNISVDDSRPIAGAKPEPVFIYFSKKQRESFISIAHEQGLTDLKGLDLNKAVQKIAGKTWRNLSDQMKQHWKDRAYVDWEMNGGKEKAKLEEERKRRIKEREASSQAKGAKSEVNFPDKIAKKSNKKRKHDDTVLKKSRLKENQNVEDKKNIKRSSKLSKRSEESDKEETKEKSLNPNNISFEAADSEGWSAMEQRIQQLTQALSRVGRVLDRHRESAFDGLSQKRSSASESFLRSLIHSPVSIMSDAHVIGWLWNEPDGVVQTLLRLSNKKPCIIPSLGADLNAIARKYEHLSYFEFRTKLDGTKNNGDRKSIAASEARQSLKTALLELRECLVLNIQFMEDTMVQHEEDTRRLKARDRRVAAQKRKREGKNDDMLQANQEEKMPDPPALGADHHLVSSVIKTYQDINNLPASHDSPMNVTKSEITDDASLCAQDINDSLNGHLAGHLHSQYSSLSNGDQIPPTSPSSNTSVDMADSKSVTSLVSGESQPTSSAEDSQRERIGPSLKELTTENSLATEVLASSQETLLLSENEKKERNIARVDCEANVNNKKQDNIDQGQNAQPIENFLSQERPTDNILSATSASCTLSQNTSVQHEQKCGRASTNSLSSVDKIPSDVLLSSDEAVLSTVDLNALNQKRDSDLTVESNEIACEKKREADNATSVSANEIGGSNAVQDIDDTTAADGSLLQHFLEHRKERYKLEAAADLLLMYAHTTTFFTLKPYSSFETTPIEVYARELGNSVPRTVMEVANEQDEGTKDIVIMNQCDSSKERLTTCAKTADSASGQLENVIGSSAFADMDESNEEGSVSSSQLSSQKKKISKKKGSKDDHIDYCAPDDIITSVKVRYSGDYVLSQLLQWYNGGIGQKPGLPNMTGCVMLPAMSGCWTDKDNAKEVKLVKWKQSRITNYSAEVRPMLIDWLEDRFKRGNPWSDEIATFFGMPTEANEDKIQVESRHDWRYPMGSPVVDFLVTGDDTSIYYVLLALRQQESTVLSKKETGETAEKPSSVAASLHSTVDEGMPVQAVANWVQCENPKCLKWRKLPWHVDTDLLPENFFCKDNVWNPESNSCDAPEDVWDEDDALVKSGDTRAEMAESSFVPGARFDVLRGSKNKYYEGVVDEVDFESEIKRIKFFFPKKKNLSEWVELNSGKIAPLNSHTKAVSHKQTAISSPPKPTTKGKDNGTERDKSSKNKSTSEANHQNDARQKNDETLVVNKLKKKKLLKLKKSEEKSAKKALFTERITIIQQKEHIEQKIRKKDKKKKKSKKEVCVPDGSTITNSQVFQTSFSRKEETLYSATKHDEAKTEIAKISSPLTDQSNEGGKRKEMRLKKKLKGLDTSKTLANSIALTIKKESCKSASFDRDESVHRAIDNDEMHATSLTGDNKKREIHPFFAQHLERSEKKKYKKAKEPKEKSFIF